MLAGDCMTPRKKFDLSQLPERPHLNYETALWEQGLTRVAGIDEAGRGALAGPVSAAVVILPADRSDLAEILIGVRDSKVMTPDDRSTWAETIKSMAVAWGVGMAGPEEIDRIGIVPATCLAIARALVHICPDPQHLLVDYLRLSDIKLPQTPLVKGDARSLSIASASILAKTARDAVLIEMDETYPGYHLAQNKGYATEMHRRAIETLGPCEIHRRSFSPITDYYSLFPPGKGKTPSV